MDAGLLGQERRIRRGPDKGDTLKLPCGGDYASAPRLLTFPATMNPSKSRPSKFTAKQSAQLGAYFAAGVGASMLATANSDAAIQVIDIGSFGIGGINGGVASGTRAPVYNFPVPYAGAIRLWNSFEYFGPVYTGLSSYGAGAEFAYNGGSASPRNFSGGASIGADSNFSNLISETAFRIDFPPAPQYSSVSADFNSGSYMGFRFAASEEGYNYGWLEVTWNSTSNQFQILAGAYEDSLDTPILAGATGPAAVPEPGTWAAAALLAGGAAFARWRSKRRDESLKEAA